MFSAQNTVVQVVQDTPELPTGTFGATALEWLAVSRNQLKESSYVKYRTIINNHLLPVFGDYQIADITRNGISQFCNSFLSEENDTPLCHQKPHQVLCAC